jgi:hypothetical protein
MAAQDLTVVVTHAALSVVFGFHDTQLGVCISTGLKKGGRFIGANTEEAVITASCGD